LKWKIGIAQFIPAQTLGHCRPSAPPTSAGHAPKLTAESLGPPNHEAFGLEGSKAPENSRALQWHAPPFGVGSRVPALSSQLLSESGLRRFPASAHPHQSFLPGGGWAAETPARHGSRNTMETRSADGPARPLGSVCHSIDVIFRRLGLGPERQRLRRTPPGGASPEERRNVTGFRTRTAPLTEPGAPARFCPCRPRRAAECELDPAPWARTA
jgi:hypothetical protein